MRILLISGGSGGHLFPLVAVLREIEKQLPDAVTCFVCSDKPEDRTMLKHEEIDMHTLPLVRSPWKHPLSLIRNWKAARTLLDTFQPDVVFSKGGGISVPLCFEARRRKIPIVLHESDAVMGRANRTVAAWASRVCLGFPAARLPSTWSVTGNPIRPQITEGKREEGLRIAGLAGKKPVLLVLGGSQGAVALNDAMRTCLEELLQTVDVIHVTGEGKAGAEKRPGYFSLPFAREEFPHLYAASTLALSRAGAGTIGELAACGIPVMLVPLEGLAQDHQTTNAKAVAASNGAMILLQKDLRERLPDTVKALVNDTHRLQEMREGMRKIAHTDSAEQITKVIRETIA